MKKLSPFAYILVIIGALTGLLVGCNKSSPEPGSDPLPEVPLGQVMVMGLPDFKVCLITNGVRVADCAITPDDLYAIPDVAWVEQELPKLALSAQNYFGLVQSPGVTFQPDDRDCDDYAKLTSTFARLTYTKLKIKSGSSLAVGDFYYTHAPGVNHACNIILARAGVGKYRLMFYDPMLLKFVSLSQEQVDSCQHYVF